jgi:hypothetical protein
MNGNSCTFPSFILFKYQTLQLDSGVLYVCAVDRGESSMKSKLAYLALVLVCLWGWQPAAPLLAQSNPATFAPAVAYNTGAVRPSVDINCAANGTVSVLLGNGDGTFQNEALRRKSFPSSNSVQFVTQPSGGKL